MSIVKPYELDRNKFLLDNKRVALIHGSNISRISATGKKIAGLVCDDLDDPLNTLEIGQKQLMDNPGILLDEGQAISMFGGRKIIWIKENAASLLKQLKLFLQLDSVEAFVIIETGQLTKTSPLKKLCEKSQNSISIACYDYTRAEIMAIIQSQISKNNLTISNENLQYLIETTGSDELHIEAEINKLVAYCSQTGEITAKDIEVLCSDPETSSINQICDQLFTRTAKQGLTGFRHAVSTGIPASQILSRIAAHIATLQKIHAAARRNNSLDAAMKSIRPPIFYKRQSSFKNQLNIWSPNQLASAARTVQTAIEKARNNSAIELEICERALLSLSAAARQSR